MLDLEVLISKLQAIDRFTTPPIAEGEVTCLEHEAGDNSVECTSLVVERFATFANSFLSCITRKLSHMKPKPKKYLKSDDNQKDNSKIGMEPPPLYVTIMAD